MKCNSCQKENPPDSMFCSACGARLQDENAPDAGTGGTPEEATKLLVEKTVKEIQREAHLAKNEVYEQIQEKAINWAKTQVVIFSAAASISLAMMALFGITQCSDFRQIVKDGKDAAANSTKQANATLEESRKLATSIDQEMTKLATLRNEIGEIDIGSVRQEIAQLKKQFDQSIEEARELGNQAQADRREVEKLQNSLFDIFIHVDASQEQRRTVLPGIVKKLHENGFVVSTSNVAQLGVDTPEVIYYSPVAEDKAKSLVKILTSDFKGIAPRFIDKRERSPREILIKLRLE
jgi:zinc ribbon protein